jgi:ABC-type multidrug transport system ATPase subunit
MLVIKNLYLKNILYNINLKVKNGLILGIFGSSGSGKSSLLKSIKGFYDNWTGEITYNNRKINKYDSSIGYILQEPIFFLHMSVMENLLLTNKSIDEINAKLKSLNLEYLLLKNINNLSGGERQKLNIVRTLLMNPRILLIDEPTSAMDEENRKFFYNVIKKLNEDEKITIILVSHDNESKLICNKIIYISDGKIINND